MCEEISKMVNEDMQKNCCFLRWHDEHYMNNWILLNKVKSSMFLSNNSFTTSNEFHVISLPILFFVAS